MAAHSLAELRPILYLWNGPCVLRIFARDTQAAIWRWRGDV